MTLLSIQNLTKRFGGLVAVNDVSFDIEAGSIVGLIGPNGSGKTTIFNCIMSIYDVTEGSIQFQGTDITDYKTHEVVNSGLARVSQESNPIARMSVAANIKLFTLPNSVTALSGGADDEEIYEIAARVGLEDALDKQPDSLPHADVRRLEIAKAIATEPELLLLDEPFAGLNQQEIREMSDQIRQLRDDGVTIVIIDHNMRGLMQLVERIMVINNGDWLADDTPEAIAENEAVQQAYLAGTETV
ncbi:ABC-type transport system ATP-binding protein (probable substrate branched-chain amino acids) [Natronomonas pharaonis DSM 2160]|uniref:ABC-type transport system ATP-binding protein (Probable substrate branched-chain amino acids) n=1 Tax=Natronomonas pharaonis (strain ATCC 35678 / DSM 2160 / CIP 103997 / JCM 8858 / NBRC 14720 / NCIMB 2260 / Gabara) TaxID=348780 RepID=A0A1U7EUZ7_NATPD|nr:ABC transporter ATP-binding protein [Natronomonas pharaonis]CAI48826.1 ABC-type transport system ATP-binding protein (probable substrate branched-chain amino acids) [Natronomonas pharaonis DSM 2160]